jgi:TPR repeat protein
MEERTLWPVRGKQASPGSQDSSKDRSGASMPTKEDGLRAEDTATRADSIAELERRTEAGDGAAASLLGDRYSEGDAVSQDFNPAFRCYSRGADLGDREAQNNLGLMFLNGLGCERDPARAIDWYRKSAEQGLAIAQYNLAKRYYGGDGIDQDYAEARKWFEKASVQSEARASCELGTMHRFGQGVPRNLLAAAEFHLIAAEAGDDVAILGNNWPISARLGARL